MSNKLKITIVTPSYNQSQYLEETINSIINQKYSNIEYIIMDGNSHDESVSIIKKYKENITYWESKKDKGQTDAINKGFNISTGEIFAWQNSDDIYMSGTFEYIAKIFSENPHIDILFGGWHFIDSKSKIISSRYIKNFSIFKFHAGLQIPPQPAVFLRKSAIDYVGGFDISRPHAMDFDLYVRILNENNYYITERILGGFRIHKDSKTIKTKRDQYADFKYVQKKYLSKTKNIYEKFFWFLCDMKEYLKDFIHAKIGIFSLKDSIIKKGVK